MEKAMNNPGVTEKVTDELHKLYFQQFKAGNLSANEYIAALGMNPNSAEAKALRAIDRARKKSGNKTAWPSKDQLKKWKTKQSNKTTNTPKRQWSAVPTNTSIKFAEDGNWYLFKGNASEKLNDAINNSIKNATATNQSLKNQSFLQRTNLRNTVTDRLNSKLKRGTARMSKNYLSLNEYPSFEQYTADLRAAGVTDQIDMTRYITGQTLWRLAKGK